MKELIHCHGYTYGERPETWSPDNRHPCNFSDELGRAVTMSECEVELVPESVWVHALKFYFHPNYADY